MKRYETITVEDMADFLADVDCDICPRKEECGSIEGFECYKPKHWLNYLNEEVSDEKILEDEKWHDVRR